MLDVGLAPRYPGCRGELIMKSSTENASRTSTQELTKRSSKSPMEYTSRTSTENLPKRSSKSPMEYLRLSKRSSLDVFSRRSSDPVTDAPSKRSSLEDVHMLSSNYLSERSGKATSSEDLPRWFSKSPTRSIIETSDKRTSLEDLPREDSGRRTSLQDLPSENSDKRTSLEDVSFENSGKRTSLGDLPRGLHKALHKGYTENSSSMDDTWRPKTFKEYLKSSKRALSEEVPKTSSKHVHNEITPSRSYVQGSKVFPPQDLPGKPWKKPGHGFRMTPWRSVSSPVSPPGQVSAPGQKARLASIVSPPGHVDPGVPPQKTRASSISAPERPHRDRAHSMGFPGNDVTPGMPTMFDMFASTFGQKGKHANAGLMLSHRRRRWSNIKLELGRNDYPKNLATRMQMSAGL